MSDARLHMSQLKRVGGDLALDFANTAGWRGDSEDPGVLHDYADLVAWAAHAGILDVGLRKTLEALAAADPERADAVYQRAIALREALYRTFAAWAHGAAIDADDLATLNDVIANARRHLRLATDGDRLAWTWHGLEDALEGPVWIVAHAAADLLTSERLVRVRECEGDKCDWLFIDASKNHSRRWCSMADCGNRAKAKRNYARNRRVQESASPSDT